MCKLLVLNRNTWNHITVWKLFVLRRDIWSYNCLQTIIIIIISWLKYLKQYNCVQIICLADNNPSELFNAKSCLYINIYAN